VGSLLF